MKKVMLLASEDMCDILQKALSDKYRTLPCSDPAPGAALLQTDPDAMILDLFLPAANGLAFLKAHTHDLPPITLALTAYVSDTLLQELAELGVSCVILAPFRLSYLKDILAERMESKNPSR